MIIDRKRNTIRNFSYGIVERVVQIMLPFICRTLLIHYVGSEFLGLDSLFSSILQMLNITELGFSAAIVYSMYQPIAENDEKKICALLNLYRKVYRIVGSCILVIGLCLIPLLPKLIKGSVPVGANLEILYLFFLGNTVLGYWLYAYKSALLTAHQRVDVISNINTVITVFRLIIQIVVLYICHNYYLYLSVMLLGTALQNIYIKRKTEVLFPQYVCKGTLSTESKADIIRRIKGLMIQKICGTSRNSMDNIIISMFVGLNSVACYGNYYTIMIGIQGFMGCITSAMAGGIGNSIAIETPEENYEKMRLFEYMYMLLAGFAMICLLCLYQPFILLWLGYEFLLANNIMVLICVYFYCLSMGAIRTLYSTGAGLFWEMRYRSALEAIVNILLNILLGYFYGISGVVVATIISIVFINFGYGATIVFRYYFKNGKLSKYYFSHIKYAVVTCIIAIIVYNVCKRILVNGIVGLFIRLLVCLVLSSFLYVAAYAKSDELKRTISFIRTFRK